MDIKWRNYKKTKVARFILLLLILAALLGTVIQFTDFIKNNRDHLSIIFEDSYLSSDNYEYKRNDVYYNLRTLVNKYKNEEFIKAGKAITEEDVIGFSIENNVEYEVFYEFENSEDYNYDLTRLENFPKFKELYPKSVEEIKKELIKYQIQEYNRILNSLKMDDYIDYYATNGKDIYTNNNKTKIEDYEKYPGYLIEDYENGLILSDNNNFYYGHEDRLSENVVIYIGFTDEYFENLSDDWSVQRRTGQKDFTNLLIVFGIMVLAFIIYIGLLPSKEEEGRERFIDKLYTDIALIIIMMLIAMFIAFLDNIYYMDKGYGFNLFTIGVTLGLGIPGLFSVISVIRNIKNKRFFRHSLIYKTFSIIKRFFRNIYRANKPERKAALLLILYSIIVLVAFPLFFITIPFGAYFLLREMRKFTLIKEGVEKIKDGELTHKIVIEKDGEFKDLAENINTISEGLDNAIDNELKSERLKAELITNVSHDIRTPLTSIITYIDLLKNEEDEEKRREYIGIIESKSNRLKTLTDNLFEASKVSSGSIPVNLTKINIVSLLSQGLGELNDKIEENNLEFIMKTDSEELNVRADGDLLWRAIENLLSNIFKYSLKNSRIYIDIVDNEDSIEFTMKNISAYKLNITAEELMERFKRGDESRTSEGSGLGLSIAESLIDIQGGSFELEIDGDLFKTIIVLPKYK